MVQMQMQSPKISCHERLSACGCSREKQVKAAARQRDERRGRRECSTGDDPGARVECKQQGKSGKKEQGR